MYTPRRPHRPPPQDNLDRLAASSDTRNVGSRDDPPKGSSKKYDKRVPSSFINVPPGAQQDHLTNSGPGRHHLFGLDPIFNYMNSWVNHRRFFSSFLVLSYEDFHADPIANLNKLAQFIGLRVSPESLKRAVESSRFGKMRDLEESGELKWSSLPGSGTTAGYKTRRGEVGGYRNEIPDEEIEAINGRIRQKLHPFFSSYFD